MFSACWVLSKTLDFIVVIIVKFRVYFFAFIYDLMIKFHTY